MAGKGDTPRPFSIPVGNYFQNYEATFGKEESATFDNVPESVIDISSKERVEDDFGAVNPPTDLTSTGSLSSLEGIGINE